MNLVLSLFPGLGLLDRAFEEEGFCIVRGPDVLWGGDIRRFHPPAGVFDGIIGGPPCQTFSPLANLVRASGHEPRFGNLIPEYERCVREAAPRWFLMEEVRQAPVPVVQGYAVHSFEWDNGWLPGEDVVGQEQQRRRMFSFGVRGSCAVDLRRWMPQALFNAPVAVGTVIAGHDLAPGQRDPPGHKHRGRKPAVTGSDGGPDVRFRKPAVTAAHSGEKRPKGGKLVRYKLPEACRLQGLEEDFLADAPFTAQAKLKAVANGVPLPLGRALARAVKEAEAQKGGSR